VFCDTSTILKYYTAEVESDAVRAQLDEADEVTLSELARVEIISAFYCRWRERLWTREQFLRMVGQFERDDFQQKWDWLPVDNAVIRYAAGIFIKLPDQTPLRASDCLHIATALHGDYNEIYTHDERQARAAEALGLSAVRIA
jgi:predicted nucleic acid-binding protein